MLDGYDETAEVQQRVVRILRLLRPYNVIGRDKIRVGRANDGGYVMINDFAGYDAAYSLGISNDVSWDAEIAYRAINVFQYDHTIEALPEENSRFHWTKTGIAASKNVDARLDTLANLIDGNGHGAGADLLLKCDIEGSEYDMLASTPSDYLSKFRQIVIETHDWNMLSDVDFASNIYRAITKLVEHHRVVHVHGNNHRGIALMGGVAIPSVLEFTLVRARDYVIEKSDTLFPTSLDAPCFPFRADFALGRFEF